MQNYEVWYTVDGKEIYTIVVAVSRLQAIEKILVTHFGRKVKILECNVCDTRD